MAAHGSSIAALQSSLTTGLSNKADQSAFDVLEGVVATKSTPDGVGLALVSGATFRRFDSSPVSAGCRVTWENLGRLTWDVGAPRLAAVSDPGEIGGVPRQADVLETGDIGGDKLSGLEFAGFSG